MCDFLWWTVISEQRWWQIHVWCSYCTRLENQDIIIFFKIGYSASPLFIGLMLSDSDTVLFVKPKKNCFLLHPVNCSYFLHYEVHNDTWLGLGSRKWASAGLYSCPGKSVVSSSLADPHDLRGTSCAQYTTGEPLERQSLSPMVNLKKYSAWNSNRLLIAL